MLDEIKSCLQFLSPGPHAIIIVLMPNRVTKEDDRVIDKIFEFFGDYHFLKKTILVMNRKTELTDKSEFMENTSANGISKLYGGCEKRFVVVENKQVWENRNADAEEVFKEIDKLEGYYDLEYLSLVHEQIKLLTENDELKASCENVGKEMHEEKQSEEEDEAFSIYDCIFS
ncbi:Hypothetical predicted protein [Mytilus galloprovincialis]|nr:Hypothetical predicted protein [Mytilus galloprovincialis]